MSVTRAFAQRKSGPALAGWKDREDWRMSLASEHGALLRWTAVWGLEPRVIPQDRGVLAAMSHAGLNGVFVPEREVSRRRTPVVVGSEGRPLCRLGVEGEQMRGAESLRQPRLLSPICQFRSALGKPPRFVKERSRREILPSQRRHNPPFCATPVDACSLILKP